MRSKFFTVLAIVVFGLASQACATYGYGRSAGLLFPGYDDLAYVTASNLALVDSIGRPSAYYGLSYAGPIPVYGYGNVPICRLQDLTGMPLVSQPVLVRVAKSRGHRAADIIGAVTVASGIAYLASDYSLKAAGAGAAIGAGVGLLATNHEYDHCLYFPVASP